MIPKMHRMAEYKRLVMILELALSIGLDMPDLRMQVSIDDFQLIKKIYRRRSQCRSAS